MLGNKNQSHRGGRGIGKDERQGVPKQPYEGNRIPFLLPEQSGLIENGFPHSHASRAVSSSIALRGHFQGQATVCETVARIERAELRIFESMSLFSPT